MTQVFSVFAASVNEWTGTAWAFVLAVLAVLVWFIIGCFVGFTDSVQLVINTGTTIVTFLMVFLIQSSQNKSDRATHLKLDELIHATQARNRMIGADTDTEEEITWLREELRRHKYEGINGEEPGA
jgi:low affinity Fe/Cu permease